MTNISVLLQSMERAYSNSSEPVTAAKAMQLSLGVPVRTVTMAPTAAEHENAATRLVSQLSARIALVARQSGVSRSGVGGSRGDNPASMIDARAATSSRPKETSADTGPMTCSGAAVITPANAAIATTIAKHDTAVNVTTPQPDKRIANTEITAAPIAASSALETPGAPGTARKPAIAANTVAITLSVSPAIESLCARAAKTANSRETKPANAATPAVTKKWRVTLTLRAFRISVTAPIPVRQLATAALVSRVAGRSRDWFERRAVASSVADTAPATSS